MNRTPTLGKIRKDIEKDGHDSSCPYIKERKCKSSGTVAVF
jgi:hypothetical protein